jgi:seryl-tRNA synthetase
MLDIALIRKQPDAVKARLATRGGSVHEQIDAVLRCDMQRRQAETKLQQLQADRNRISKEIGAKKRAGEDTSEIEAQVRGFGDDMKRLNEEAAALDVEQRELLLSIPNLPHEQCPVGDHAGANPEIRVWGEKPAFNFQPKSHVELGEKLGLFSFDRATKIAGPAFVCYLGAGARLERALVNFLLDTQTQEAGYTEVLPPLLVNRDALIGTTQLPKFLEQQYHVGSDDLFLVPTAEVPVTNLHREEILRADELPIKYAAYTPCFRREAGAAGLGTRGLIRTHQFDKVELVKICRPEDSMTELESLTLDAERILQKLGLHYRVIELCTGDIGFGSAKTYDIEVWAPGQGGYLEVSSCSNFADYQARRMALRFKGADGKNHFCHTLNGSGTALARLYVALLENYQQADGSIEIPEALRGHFGAGAIGR